jgi:hypothetical protein
MQDVSQLRKRLAPATPITLEMTDDNGDKFSRSLKLCFDFAAGVAIEEKTGLNLRDFKILTEMEKPTAMSVVFWAALLRHQPEYDSEDGLEVVRSYMDESNYELIAEALWHAYLAYQSKAKREFLAKMRQQAEERIQRGETASPLPESAAGRETSPSPGTTSGPSAASTSGSPTTSSAA